MRQFIPALKYVYSSSYGGRPTGTEHRLGLSEWISPIGPLVLSCLFWRWTDGRKRTFPAEHKLASLVVAVPSRCCTCVLLFFSFERHALDQPVRTVWPGVINSLCRRWRYGRVRGVGSVRATMCVAAG